MIPFVDLTAQHQPIAADLHAALDRVTGRSGYILGAEVEQFEGAFAKFTEADHAVGVANGTDALALTLQALGVGPGDEVIVPSFTFIATALAVVRTGARVVCVDVDERTALMTAGAAAAAITPRTKAILPVHLFGRAIDLEPFLKLGPPVVEDSCQAHGSAPLRGRAACFSFYPAKNLGALGDGGAVVTNDAALAQKLRRLRDYGQSVKYRHDELGTNSRLDGLQAAFLSAKLPHLRRWNGQRAAAARAYDDALAGAGVTRPEVVDAHVWHLYVIRAKERDRLRESLQQKGIQTGIHYPVPVHLQPCLASLGYARGAFPASEKLASEVVSLPMFPELTVEQVREVARAILSA